MSESGPLTGAASLVVLIPAYNAEKTIERAVKSAIGQPGIEAVVVVDDGSRDATAERAGWAGARVLIQANAGPAAARNRGLEEVAAWPGDKRHVLFLDADDELCEGAAEAITGMLGERSEAACAVGGHTQIGERETKERWPERDWFYNPSFLAGEGNRPTSAVLPHRGYVLGTSHVFCTTGLVLTARAIGAGARFDPSLNFGEDRDLIYRAGGLGPIVVMDQLIVNKHDEPGRMTASPARLVRWLEDVVKLCDKHDPVDNRSPRADALVQDNLQHALGWVFKHAQRGLASQSEQLPDQLVAFVHEACAKRGWKLPRSSRGFALRRVIGNLARSLGLS